MRALALALSLLLAGEAVAGDDTPYRNPLAGIYSVNTAITTDGTELGKGWYLTDERMKLVAAATQKPAPAIDDTSAKFLVIIGAVAGVLVGAGAAIGLGYATGHIK